MRAAMIALLLAAAAASQSTPPSIEDVWHNPRNSVAVKTGACGDRLCGWIVRADDAARIAARGSGAPELVGTTLLRDYRLSGHNRWAGQVWVPDMGRAFGSTITMIDVDTLSVKGCLVGGFICRSQLWRRE